MTFVDTIEKYGHLLKDEDLGAAYRRCGKSFKGQLGQHFVVLKDRPMSQQVQNLRQDGGRGRGVRGQAQRGGYQTLGRK